MDIIAFDSHKRYTILRAEDEKGKLIREDRVEHFRGNITKALEPFVVGTKVALETIGSYYWIVSEIEDAGMEPILINAYKAKKMMGSVNKTDRLDVKGLCRLMRAGVAPEVWIPPKEVLDKRDLPRTRMVFSGMRTKLKNRIHSVFQKYGLHDFESSDIFSKKGRKEIESKILLLPENTRFTTERLLDELDCVIEKLKAIEERMHEVFDDTPETELLDTVPGVGFLLSVVILSEVGDIRRFKTASQFAAYCGTVPRVHSSGGKTRYGTVRNDVNHYLKWAFFEAANHISAVKSAYRGTFVLSKYMKLRYSKGHAKACGAIARHLAEAVWSMLMKQEAYKDPFSKVCSSSKA